MIKSRLERLAKRMDFRAKQIQRNKPTISFSLSTWGFKRHKPLPRKCGTQACAVGDATQMREFRKLGLRTTQPYVLVPKFRNEEGWGAVEKFFGLNYVQARMLFDSNYYDFHELNNPAAVAARIREFISTGQVS